MHFIAEYLGLDYYSTFRGGMAEEAMRIFWVARVVCFMTWAQLREDIQFMKIHQAIFHEHQLFLFLYFFFFFFAF